MSNLSESDAAIFSKIYKTNLVQIDNNYYLHIMINLIEFLDSNIFNKTFTNIFYT